MTNALLFTLSWIKYPKTTFSKCNIKLESTFSEINTETSYHNFLTKLQCQKMWGTVSKCKEQKEQLTSISFLNLLRKCSQTQTSDWEAKWSLSWQTLPLQTSGSLTEIHSCSTVMTYLAACFAPVSEWNVEWMVLKHGFNTDPGTFLLRWYRQVFLFVLRCFRQVLRWFIIQIFEECR